MYIHTGTFHVCVLYVNDVSRICFLINISHDLAAAKLQLTVETFVKL
jgi:hypothetical protein